MSQVPQVNVRQLQQPTKRVFLPSVQLTVSGFKKPVQHQIQLQQAAPAMPAYAVVFAHRFQDLLVLRLISPQTMRLTSISLMLPIAFVGFRCLGQTSTQFMIE